MVHQSCSKQCLSPKWAQLIELPPQWIYPLIHNLQILTECRQQKHSPTRHQPHCPCRRLRQRLPPQQQPNRKEGNQDIWSVRGTPGTSCSVPEGSTWGLQPPSTLTLRVHSFWSDMIDINKQRVTRLSIGGFTHFIHWITISISS